MKEIKTAGGVYVVCSEHWVLNFWMHVILLETPETWIEPNLSAKMDKTGKY